MKSKFDNESAPNPMHTMNTDDLLGHSFLLPPDENGAAHHPAVIQKVLDAESVTENDAQNTFKAPC